MKPKVLADALVEAGILDYVGNHREMSRPGYTELGRFYWVKGDEAMEDDALDHDDFITDWRVAGKVLESMREQGLHIIIEQAGIIIPLGMTPHGETVSTGSVINDSLPRAIIEAWYEATEQGESDE